MFISSNFIGGSDIMAEMNKSGELRRLLVKDGIVAEEAAEESESSPKS